MHSRSYRATHDPMGKNVSSLGRDVVSPTLAQLGSQMVRRGLLSAEQLHQAQKAAARSVRKHDRLHMVLADVLARQRRLTNYQQATLERGRGYLLSVGPYVVFEPLGNGAMSCVYRARRRDTGDMVALKLVPKRLARNSDVAHLWHREVEAALTVDHPNLVRARAAQIDHQPFYLVMDLVEGPTLKSLLAHRGRLDTATSLALVHQVARGLDALDRRGFVHGDVKPGNIMVTWHGQVKLIDFGFSHDPTRPDAITRRGLVIGTANYLAPEAGRDTREPDIRADLYSLGVTLYEMLTGALPFASGSKSEALRSRRRQAPRDPREHLPHLPDDVVSVVLRLLKRDPQQRYASPRELRTDLTDLRRAYPLRGHSGLSATIAMEPSGPVGAAPEPAGTEPPTLARLPRRLVDVVCTALASLKLLPRPVPDRDTT